MLRINALLKGQKFNKRSVLNAPFLELVLNRAKDLFAHAHVNDVIGQDMYNGGSCRSLVSNQRLIAIYHLLSFYGVYS